MRRPGAAAILALAILVPPTGVAGQQLDFRRTARSGDEAFQYHWRDAVEREHRLAFTLTRSDIREAEAAFAEFSMEGMWRELEQSLRDETRRFGNNTQIDLVRKRDQLTWTVRASDQPTADQLMRRLSQRFERDQAAYLARYQRRLLAPRILVDYGAATAALQKPLRPVADALGRSDPTLQTDRAKAGLALGFFQEIPYAVLEDKERRGGDFLPGPALLAQNRGDCDSKAVALAAVLRSLAPSRKLAIVTMPGHAVLAIDLPAEKEEATVRSQGRQYVAVEPAGPAMMAIGQVTPRSAKYLREGREIEIWPLN